MKFILLSQVKIYHQLSYIEETNKSNALLLFKMVFSQISALFYWQGV